MSREPALISLSPAAALYSMRRDPLGFFPGLAREHGDVVRFRLGDHANDLIFFNHPDYIRDVLITQDRNFTKWFAVDRIREILGDGLFVSEGEWHHRQRRLAQPAFHRERIARYAREMAELASRVRERWQPGRTMDVCREMNWLAMMIVARTLFGADVEKDAEKIGEALDDILEQFERSILPAADREDFDKAMKRLDDVVYRIIRERRAGEVDRGDLLSMLLLARDEEDGQTMNDLEVRDEAMTIFLAGHETSANAMAWSWYLLSQNPEAEQRMHEELDRVLGDRIPDLSDVPHLAYTARVFSEALRLYPPLWAVGRRAMRECAVGDCIVPEETVVIVSAWVTQRDARWFPEPERFDPERWLPEARADRPKFSYFPFSAGSRSCLGEAFAGMEGVLCLAVLAQRWRLKLAPGQRVALQPQLTLRARNGIKMQAELRTNR